MKPLLLRANLGLFALPVLFFCSLWLGVPWRVMWWAAFLPGLLLLLMLTVRCARRMREQSALRQGHQDQQGWLFATLLAQMGLCALALGLSGSAYSTTNSDLVSSVYISLVVFGFVSLIAGAVGLCGQVLRALPRSAPLQVLPRTALWGALVFVGHVTGWAAAIVSSYALGGQKTNLQVVEQLGNAGLRIFTPARFAREIFATKYFWSRDPATPALSLWPLAGAWSHPDSYIRQHAHPKDPWSYAQRLTDDRKQDSTNGKERGFGLSIADEDEPPPGQAVTASPVAGSARVTDVKHGSPAALAGVQRGDVVVTINGTPWVQWRRAKTASATLSPPVAANISSSPAVGEFRPVRTLQLRKLNGDLITLDQRAAYAHTGLQQVKRVSNDTLYLRLDGFERDTATYVEKALKKLALADPNALQDIRTLVLDLRGNPGGEISSAHELGRLLFANSLSSREVNISSDKPDHLGSLADLLYTSSVKADGSLAHKSYNWTQPGMGGGGSKKSRVKSLINPQALLVLTNADTCSAAEYLVHGVRSLTKLPAITFGQPTCGKPYGYSKHDYAGFRFNVVDMAIQSAGGRAAYPKGIAPDCLVVDPIAAPFAAAGDSVFEAAMAYAKTGGCQVSTGGSGVAKGFKLVKDASGPGTEITLR